MGRIVATALLAALACSGWACAQESSEELEHPMVVLERALSGIDCFGEETKARYRQILRERLAAEGPALSLEELSDAAVGRPVDAEALEKAKFATHGLYNRPRDIWRREQRRYSDDAVQQRYLEGREIVTLLRKRRPPTLSPVVPHESMSRSRKEALNRFVGSVKAHHEWYRRNGAYGPLVREAAVESFRMRLYEYFDWPVFEAQNQDEIERQVTEVARLNTELRGRKLPPAAMFSESIMIWDTEGIMLEVLLWTIRDDMTPAMKHPLEDDEFEELLRLVREKARKGDGWGRPETVRAMYDELTLEKHYGHLDPSVFILWAGVPQEELDAYIDLRNRAFELAMEMRREKERLERFAQLAAEVKRDIDETAGDLLDILELFEGDPGAQDAQTPAAQAATSPTPDASATSPTPDATATAGPSGPTKQWWAVAAVVLTVLVVAVVVLRARKRNRAA